MAIRNFEPTVQWSNPDGTLTERAKGYLRALFDYTGASSGAVPVASIGTGTATQFYRGDGVFATPAYPVGANPSVSAGLTTTNGVATTFMRSDAAPAISVGISPTWTGAHTFTQSVTFSGSIDGNGAFGCNGATPQTSATAGAAVATTASTQTTPYGYTTQAQADDIVTRLNEIRAALVANGIMT